ncbi:hypothetical protein EG345_00685 [Chryseobacterium carnipullorum]|nr:hypothetical protein EG345_00685 [Chryseobacterium carnipullorum]
MLIIRCHGEERIDLTTINFKSKIIINIFFFLLKIFKFLCFKILWKKKTLCEGTVLTKFT